ncbi:MAG: peroxiredoxin [Candidatus Marinimicrobia bacterium]|nr:peroxiredoxin [Candidatus Neomarinimicrobiota bacterium]
MKHLFAIIILFSIGFSQLKVNTVAPDFTLSDAAGIPHTLSDYRGQFVILYFYPKDNTPGCTAEACSFRDNFSEIREQNATILGVSWDSSKNHAAFTEKYNLPFTLLSDIKGDVATSYKAAGWFMPKRYTYIIDPLGEIVKVYTQFDISAHSDEIIDFLKSISKQPQNPISN